MEIVTRQEIIIRRDDPVFDSHWGLISELEHLFNRHSKCVKEETLRFLIFTTLPDVKEEDAKASIKAWSDIVEELKKDPATFREIVLNMSSEEVSAIYGHGEMKSIIIYIRGVGYELSEWISGEPMTSERGRWRVTDLGKKVREEIKQILLNELREMKEKL